ncbi:Uncharacterised protein [Pantoea agglomerans]|uniref:Uncharacterized protein n=1 Tax=Enterobacter agglomerans TaxID=549 RepID=A0A379LUR3_ENTAG|nr:Uncharacterised protein [Pantoea agglomerans]
MSDKILSCLTVLIPASGKAVVTTADLMNPESLTKLPLEVKMHWFNPEKSKGILYVTYL